MRRLIFGPRKPPSEHPLEKGDLCLALPSFEQQSASAPKKTYLATVVDHKKNKVIFFDDGSETVYVVEKISEASPKDREVAKQRYTKALTEAKAITALTAAEIIDPAIEKVKEAMGGSLGADGMVSYTKGDESREGQLLCDTLIGNFGALAAESPALRWMSTHWRDVCKAADKDHSGTISEDEAMEIWDKVSLTFCATITSKLDILGAPPRLYRGDLCLALPLDKEIDRADPKRLYLATCAILSAWTVTG